MYEKNSEKIQFVGHI